MVAFFALAVTSSFVLFALAAGVLTGALLVVLRLSHHGSKQDSLVREAMPSFRRSLARLEIELARVRRYDHPLSVIVVQVPRVKVDELYASVFSNVKDDLRERHVQRIVSLHVGAILYDCLRSSDMPMWDTDQNRYVVVLPESNRLRAQEAANRLRRLVPSHIGTTVKAGVAEFPRDGLAIDALVSKAAQRSLSTADPGPVEQAAAEESHSLDIVERNVVERSSVERRAQSG